MDWFQIIRLSILRHLYDTQQEAWSAEHQVSSKSIRERVARDFTKMIQLRWAADISCGNLRSEVVLRPGINQKLATAADFLKISEW